jgi:mRNA interferase RelE/StbE
VKRLVYSVIAARQFAALPAVTRNQILDKVRRYAQSGVGDITKLKGRDGLRLRVRDYRVIFKETNDAIVLREVGHRREVYR